MNAIPLETSAVDHPTPCVWELDRHLSVLEVVRALEPCERLLVLESTQYRPERGRYSYVMAEPIAVEDCSDLSRGTDPFQLLREWSRSIESAALPHLPPFQGGVAGLLGYELGRCWEALPERATSSIVPDISAGLYPWVISWDHEKQRVWLIAHGWPETTTAAARTLAQSRGAAILERLSNKTPSVEALPTEHATNLVPSSPPAWARPIAEGVWSDLSREEYLTRAAQVIDYIRAGDIFQANLTQRLLFRNHLSPVALYERLRACNPAPFAGLYCGAGWSIISASPERFLELAHGVVSTRPIKGTRRRSVQVEADLFTRDSLRQSEKDQAENVMIVDLLRNDLSRVCRDGTVRVPQLCEVETYATVQHLVSEVCGELAPGYNAWDLLAATFPGGSITGAPKVRAMEIIAELEPTPRGPYTGSLFYVGHDGRMDCNILIRTFVQEREWLQCGAGGGIVAQSDPVSEYEETWHKAAAMLAALQLQGPQ